MNHFIGRKREREQENTNRLNIILAIIFLLSGMIMFRLFFLQIIKGDRYTMLALGQHQAYSKLIPERGNIFMSDESADGAKQQYPLATSKEFAQVFAIPKDIKDPQGTAGILYEIFDKIKTENEIDEMLLKDEVFKELENPDIDVKRFKELSDFKEVKKQAELELRKSVYLGNYINTLSKKDDPYEPLKRKVDETTLKTLMDLKIDGLSYVLGKERYYPEGNIGSQILGFVGFSNDERQGKYGLEGFFNEELTGKMGSIKTERSGQGELIIVNDREYEKPQNGSDIYLTINRSIQFEACKRLGETALQHGAEGGSIIVMDPKTGAVIAMCSWPDYDPNNYNEVDDANLYNNPAIFDAYEPGSIFKVITMAAGLNEGVVSPNTTYEDKGYINVAGWNKPIKNSDFSTHGGHGVTDMVTVLEQSLNTGAIFVMNKVGPEKFAEYVKNFGFGEKTGIELETEGLSNIVNLLRKTIRPVEAATASFGQGISVTSLQMVAAYAAIANGGILMKPYVVEKIVHQDGEEEITEPVQVRRVISEKASLLLSSMMVNVVENGHSKPAAVKGYYVAGKTGTAQVADKQGGYYENNMIHTLEGFAPVEDPRFVMLIKLNNPKDAKFAESTCAPLFGELAKFILDYYKVPKTR
jgi:cell division protein FtsI/penicillin-binding protein 2